MAINLDFSEFHSILVDVDALGKQHPALDAALELATRLHAKVVRLAARPAHRGRGRRELDAPGRTGAQPADHRHRAIAARGARRSADRPPRLAAFGEYLLQPRMSPQVFADFLQRAERAAHQGTASLLEAYPKPLADVRVEVVRGAPQDVIPTVASDQHADMIVMGSMGRSGPAGIFMGNTAERVLQRWHGSVLVVKPLGRHRPHAWTINVRSSCISNGLLRIS